MRLGRVRPYGGGTINVDAIRARFAALEPFLDERTRWLVAASEARALGHGGIEAMSAATGIARSTIGRGLSELAGVSAEQTGRIRRRGAGRKLATEGQRDRLAERPAQPHVILRVATLDNDPGPRPAKQIWTSRDAPWLAEGWAVPPMPSGRVVVRPCLRGLHGYCNMAQLTGKERDRRRY